MNPGDVPGEALFYLAILALAVALLGAAAARGVLVARRSRTPRERTSDVRTALSRYATAAGVGLLAFWFWLPAEPTGYLNLLLSDFYFLAAMLFVAMVVVVVGHRTSKPTRRSRDVVAVPAPSSARSPALTPSRT